MKKKIIIAVICVLMVAVMLTACTESYKIKAVQTDFSDLTVTSNGGLAVKVGKYLYYINGYAGNEAVNTFGKVQKGAIARVELGTDGTPKDDTNTIIVPKNVYNTVKTSGLYVIGEYIYYSTPSTERDSSGMPKVDKMHLMRTKLDGTGTQIIAKFDDFTPVYKVVKDYVIYVNSSQELRIIDLTSKKFKDTLISDKVTNYHMPTHIDNSNEFVDGIFYVKASPDKNQTHSEVWYYSAGGEAKKAFAGNKDSYDVNKLEHPSGYNITLVESSYISDKKIRLVYTKTDSGANATSSGTYSYDFDNELKFEYSKEVRYSWKINYTKLNFLDDNHIIALSDSKVVLLKNNNGSWIRETLIEKSSEPKIFDIVSTDDIVEVYYIASSKLYRIQVLAKTETGYDVSIKSASEVFATPYSETWLGLDKVGSYIYFFNSDVKDNMYYLNLDTVINRNEGSKKPALLGLINNADQVDLLDD